MPPTIDEIEFCLSREYGDDLKGRLDNIEHMLYLMVCYLEDLELKLKNEKGDIT